MDAMILQLGGLLTKLADAVSKFGDSIAHLVTLGAKGYDAAAARKAHADLIELRINLETLVAGANLPLVRSINDYVDLHMKDSQPPSSLSSDMWRAVMEKVDDTTRRVNALLKDVKKIRNEFVLEDSYRTNSSTLVYKVVAARQIAPYGRTSEAR